MQTLTQFDAIFGTDEKCRQFLVKMRWPDGVVKCPRCQSDKVYALPSRAFHWVCKSGKQTVDTGTGELWVCHKRNGYRFSVTSATIFENTKVSLNIWFKIGFLMLTAKKGISALQIHRVMFGEKSSHDYHTSWYICMRWRAAMAGHMYASLSGVVEADETYIGGKDYNRHKGKKSSDLRRKAGPKTGLEKPGESVGYGKVGVIGAISRKGNVVARVIGSMDAPTLSSFVRRATDEKVSLIITDENQSYRHIGGKRPHQTVNHSKMEYVRGAIHTNNIESFWSLFERVQLSLQQSREPRDVRRSDYDVQPIVEGPI